MKTIFTAAIAAATVAAAFATMPAAAETRQERGEARLAEMLEGRTAGEPESCITAFNSNDVRVIENVGVTYESGGTIWVARVSNPRDLDWNDVPIFERTSSQLCKQDVIRTVDRSTGMYSGGVFLGDFVPYTRDRDG